MKENLDKKKRQILRNNEYYLMQNVFDTLYEQASKGRTFNNLIEHISSEENILLAYRNIKKNKGSTTVGTDKLDVSYYKKWNKDKFVKYIQGKLQNYTPKSVKRVEIPKPNGKTRPLGIPCMDDRIIQQCIKQVIEPICEAKFYKHSYGFRPNRSTERAIARCMFLMNKAKMCYVVDIDIKGFFDNVSHTKLKKQLWTIGIQDKNLISIIGKILKSEIQGKGVPTQGTPQGGIISPLLSNVVLSELDWWISSQWETLKTQHEYSLGNNKYRVIRNSNLKEIQIVRYADDFKIFCRDYKTARKIYIATQQWLKERLDLEISQEKSKITNVRKNRSEFLGFSLKVKAKKGKYVCQSNISGKAKKQTIDKLKNQIKRIQKNCNSSEVSKLNGIILGSHNYYKIARNVSLDFGRIHFLVTKTLKIRLRSHITDKPKISKTFTEFYGNYNGKLRTIQNVTIFPIYGCKTQPPMSLNQKICNYSTNGRELIYKKLRGYSHLIEHLLKKNYDFQSVEYKDNRISLIAGQQGKCFVTGNKLEIGSMECHHKKPKSLGGTDDYNNLVWISFEVHKLIHSNKQDAIEKYVNLLNLDDKGLKRVNSLRKQVEYLAI